MLKSLKSRLFGKSVEDEASTRLLGDRSLDQWKQEPIDKYNLIYFVYGVAMLLPWNVFITASEFFAKRFAGTIYEERFQNYFSTYSTLTNLLTFILVLWLQSKSLFKMNSFIPIVINTIVFGTMAITVEIDFQGEDYFWFVLFFMVLTGGTTSFFQNAVFSEASRLPPVYVQAVLSGQGIAGVVVAVSSILSALAGSSDSAPDDTSIARSAFLYFLSALLITLTALVGRVLVTQLPFYNYHIHSGYEDNESGEQDGVENEPVTVIDVVRKSYGLIFSVAYVFVITLILFPSLTALIKSVHRSNNSGRFFDDDIFVAFHFLLFNVGDWVGRVMPLSERFQVFRVKSLVSMSLLRTIFVPLFLVCNVVVSSERNLPVLVRNDFVYFLIVWIFAVSNGWIGSLCMMAAPQQKAIKSGKEKSMVGSVMSFSLVLGLAIGGLLSFPFRQLI
ncbi:hypothetical protein G6F57_004406 [Rhizopus arrhizus]|uniref:Nucleoside transporter n=1 Tax=Rhizopus oryzae TaxID=64495 RepID=A0A9P6XDI0_RHIOR|nr:hypothetical protein G6F22_000701 [Rhizopus arrhizus]KAG1426238.1 hypothetical protein G6F58_001585 [Rhizopus delemar]KAG0843250.1 hypothetical protein G6F19_000586 [Rhizopus arrhizus]KAG0879210.1 hypothetical protein G6F16_000345 [Rhizopus arrhizus]KAG0884233.1 hypothetical protein G6F15_005269 [Rhizopus arrhizus]